EGVERVGDGELALRIPPRARPAVPVVTEPARERGRRCQHAVISEAPLHREPEDEIGPVALRLDGPGDGLVRYELDAVALTPPRRRPAGRTYAPATAP